MFLTDPRSDRAFVLSRLHEAWSRMAEDSPNAGPGARSTLLAAVDRFEITSSRNADGTESQGRTDLVARRGQTRKLCARLQEIHAETPEPRRSPWGGGTAPAIPEPPSASGPTSVRVAVGSARRTAGTALLVLVVVALLSATAFAAPSLWSPGQGPDPASSESTAPEGADAGETQVPTAPATATPSSAAVTVEVPGVVGNDVTDARDRLLGLGLVPTVSAVPSGTRDVVQDQDPDGGAELHPGDEVRLQVGDGLVVVPDLRGVTLPEAQAQLAAAGLEVGGTTSEDSARPADTVLRTAPEGSTPVPVRDPVDIVVGSGFNDVPDVRSAPLEDACERLVEAGFAVEVAIEASSEAADTVVRVSPEGRHPVESVITLTVAGPTPAPSSPAPSTEEPPVTDAPEPTPSESPAR